MCGAGCLGWQRQGAEEVAQGPRKLVGGLVEGAVDRARLPHVHMRNVTGRDACNRWSVTPCTAAARATGRGGPGAAGDALALGHWQSGGMATFIAATRSATR